MFGFGGKKKKQLEAKISWAQDAAYRLTLLQCDLGRASDNGENVERLATPFAFGYIFGFSDALIQYFGLSNEGEVIGRLAIVFIRIFGEEKGARILGASIRMQSDPGFVNGRQIGGDEAIRYVSSGCKDPPFGLMHYLTGSEHGEKKP